MERKKPGPASKGDRDQVRARVPLPLLEALKAEARRRGMTFNDFIGETLSDVVGVPYNQQEALKTA